MLPLLTTCYSLLTVLTAHYSHCSHYCSLLTAYQVSATKSSDSQVKTSGKAINMWWDAPYSGYPAVPNDIIMALFSVAFVFAIILLNTSSLLLAFAGLFGILASLPLAMFLWMLCGQVHSESSYLLTILLAYFWILRGHRRPK